MSVALLASANFAVNNIVAAIRAEGIEVCQVTLDRQDVPPSHPVAIGVLLVNLQGVVDVGEQTSKARRLLGAESHLILCTSLPSVEDREILLDCGATQIITPYSWAAEHVAERVLGQLILMGQVSPTASGPLCGGTRKLREIYREMQTLAPLSESILILGETGTGKELVAREIHRQSRNSGAFIPINCPEINPELLSSELFGHEKGAFTDARQARRGLLAEAGKGTIFLDEIGDLDLQAQAKLLRVLEDKKVRRVGANQWDDIHARILLATHRNLEEEVLLGRFRRDLFERMRGFVIELPPLRERKEDIPLLVHHFVVEYGREYQKNLHVPPGALDCLFRSDWPGNVRELRAVVRRAAVYADEEGGISTVRMQEAIRGRKSTATRHTIAFDPTVDSWRALQNRAQAAYIRAVLEEANGNKETAAKIAGLSRSQFYEKLKEIENS